MRTHLARRVGREDAGITLVEVMVAMFVLSIVMVGVAATLMNALGLSQEARGRAQAANLVAEEMERLRGLNPQDIPVGLSEFSADSAGPVTYQVRREVTWISIDATGNACQGGGDAEVLRVDVFVTWDGARGDGVRSQTTLTPGVGTFTPDSGHLAVEILDRDAAPASNHLVTITGPGVVESAITGSQGCVVFNNLPPGTYEISFRTDRHVDMTRENDIVDNASVISAATTTAQFFYDREATLVTTLEGRHGGLVPDGLDVVLFNTRIEPDSRLVEPGSGSVRTIEKLFPFAAGYLAWATAEGCADADPQAHEIERAGFPTNPGQTTEGVIPLASVQVTVTNMPGQPVPNLNLVARHGPDPESCDEEVEIPLGQTDAEGKLLVALPLGSWQITAPGQSPQAIPAEFTLTDFEAFDESGQPQPHQATIVVGTGGGGGGEGGGNPNPGPDTGE